MTYAPDSRKLGIMHARLKNLSSGIAITVLTLLFSEAFARTILLLLPGTGEFTELRNQFDSEARTLRLAPGIPLADTLLWNIEENPLIIPDRDLIFRVRPNPEGGVLYGYTGINPRGFRGPEIPEDPARGARRLLMLGDSVMFGWGITDYPSTIQARLEDELRSRGGGPWEVYNLAQPGYSTYQGALLFRRWYTAVRPDIVVLSFGWNDIWPTPRFTDRQTAAIARLTNHPLAMLAQQTGIYALLNRLARIWQSRPDGTAYRPRVPKAEVRALLDEMIGEAERQGAKVVLLVPPHPCWWGGDGGLLASLVAEVYSKFRDRVLSPRLTPMRCGAADAAGYFFNDDFHPNARGAALVASEIAGEIAATHP